VPAGEHSLAIGGSVGYLFTRTLDPDNTTLPWAGRRGSTSRSTAGTRASWRLVNDSAARQSAVVRPLPDQSRHSL